MKYLLFVHENWNFCVVYYIALSVLLRLMVPSYLFGIFVISKVYVKHDKFPILISSNPSLPAPHIKSKYFRLLYHYRAILIILNVLTKRVMAITIHV